MPGHATLAEITHGMAGVHVEAERGRGRPSVTCGARNDDRDWRRVAWGHV